VLNLRPEDQTRMLGRPHLRVKAQTNMQQLIDRMSMERPRNLPVDPLLEKLFKKDTLEKSIQPRNAESHRLQQSNVLRNSTKEKGYR